MYYTVGAKKKMPQKYNSRWRRKVKSQQITCKRYRRKVGKFTFYCFYIVICSDWI